MEKWTNLDLVDRPMFATGSYASPVELLNIMWLASRFSSCGTITVWAGQIHWADARAGSVSSRRCFDVPAMERLYHACFSFYLILTTTLINIFNFVSRFSYGLRRERIETLEMRFLFYCHLSCPADNSFQLFPSLFVVWSYNNGLQMENHWLIAGAPC